MKRYPQTLLLGVSLAVSSLCCARGFGYVFLPGQDDVGHNGEYRLQYSAYSDAYYQNANHAAPLLSLWNTGTFSYTNMTRTWETSYNIGYLNRATGGSSNPGEIIWKFDLSNTGGTVEQLMVKSVTWNISYGDYDSWSKFYVSTDGVNWGDPYATNTIHGSWNSATGQWDVRSQWESAVHDLSTLVQGDRTFYIRGTSGTEGTGSLGGNHAQLFRETSAPQYLFDVQVGLKMDSHTFQVDHADLYDSGKWRMQYDSGTDAYYQNGDHAAPVIQGWARGRYEDTNVCWVDERPTYNNQFLARKDANSNSEIIWKYDFSATGLYIGELKVLAKETTFDPAAWVNWAISTDGTQWADVSSLLGGTSLADLSAYVRGADTYYLKATMGGAWAIATQLFRGSGPGTYLFDTQVTLVPEPGTLPLLGAGGACLLATGAVLRRRRRRGDERMNLWGLCFGCKQEPQLRQFRGD